MPEVVSSLFDRSLSDLPNKGRVPRGVPLFDRLRVYLPNKGLDGPRPRGASLFDRLSGDLPNKEGVLIRQIVWGSAE